MAHSECGSQRLSGLVELPCIHVVAALKIANLHSEGLRHVFQAESISAHAFQLLEIALTHPEVVHRELDFYHVQHQEEGSELSVVWRRVCALLQFAEQGDEQLLGLSEILGL